MSRRLPARAALWCGIFAVLLAASQGPLAAQEYRPSLLVFPPFGHSYGFHKAGPFYLKLLLGLGAALDDPQGIACTRLAATDDTTTADDDDELTVYFVNGNRHQIIYNHGLTGLRSFGGLGAGDGQFHTPCGVAAGPDGFVYVADVNNNRVVCLYNDGRRMSFVRNIGVGELSHPRGCALDSRGNLYVADTGHDRVVVYDPVGRMFTRFGDSALFDRPSAIAVTDFMERWSYRHETAIIVIDADGGRIRTFDQFGNPSAQASGGGIGLPGAYFGFAAIDYYGSVYVTDMVNHQIHKFDRGLNYVASFGREGDRDFEFESPRGIAIWKRYGQVFVMERGSAQYYWIGIDGYIKSVSPNVIDRQHPGVTIQMTLYEPADFKLEIADSAGNVVRNLIPEFREKLGDNYVVWDGLDENGREVARGDYTIKLTMEPTYSSKTYFSKTLTAKVRKE
ncbi:MAG TPA: FlgD immunoglobulin-like domain containing protein [Candidatus Edwardsbacteria bacterium]|nr:FlgD immunoglobulin-like domain containing protein [Candidatus Edwardsbacteria bacterium]